MSIDFGFIGGSQPLMDFNFRGNFLHASIVKSGWVSCLYGLSGNLDEFFIQAAGQST